MAPPLAMLLHRPTALPFRAAGLRAVAVLEPTDLQEVRHRLEQAAVAAVRATRQGQLMVTPPQEAHRVILQAVQAEQQPEHLMGQTA
jgi:hypothetical protein